MMLMVTACNIFSAESPSKSPKPGWGVLECRSSGTTLSASSRSGTSDFAAFSGLSAYALKPGLIYNITQQLMKTFSTIR